MLFLRRFLRDEPLEAAAGALYGSFARQARQPDFYLSFGIPDSVDGRFEMVALHAFLVFRRLKGQGPSIDRLSQASYDLMFKEMDMALRELGAADLGVGKRIKYMTEALNGRIQIYEKAIDSSDPALLPDALTRNLYGTIAVDPNAVAAMVAYIRATTADLGTQEVSVLAEGRVRFPAPADFIL